MKALINKDGASGISLSAVIRMQLCAYVCGGQNLVLGIILSCSPPSTLRQDLWLNPELADSASLASQLAPGIISPPLCWDSWQTAASAQHFM